MTFEVQVSIPYITNLPRDVATNVWHFNRVGVPPVLADYEALVIALRTFYSNVYGTAGNMAGYAVPDLTRMKIYDLGDTPPRAPKHDVVGVIAAVGEDYASLPPETSVVCSISGVGVSGIPISSQRGRIYLGCLGNGLISSPLPTSFPTVSETFRSTVVSAAEAMVGLAVDAGFTWVVYSRKLDTGFPVVKGFVDNAFDTQRRRGQDPTLRTTWAI